MALRGLVLALCALLLVAANVPVPVLASHRTTSDYDDLESQMDEEEVNASARLSASWRTGYHFQPRKNWMNDPNGPMYYGGYYHLFYQYNPYGYLWGNTTWGHTVSEDLIHWKYVDDAALKGGPGWYDIYGTWSGSVTFLANGTPAILYTGWSNVSETDQIQTQNLLMPDNPSDPLLRYWSKSERNPVIVAEPNMNASKFRDPTTAWYGKDGDWRILIGSREGDETDDPGTVYVYKSSDFVNWTYLHPLHMVVGTGMWECPDLFPIALSGKLGLDTSARSVGANGIVKYVLKVSLDFNTKKDGYAVGNYDLNTDTFTAEDKAIDIGLGLMYDYGIYYASKSFFDSKTSRRILNGWINDSTSVQNLHGMGWSGLQAIPRHIWFDSKFKKGILQAPIEELTSLRHSRIYKTNLTLPSGTVTEITPTSGSQMDIEIKFHKPDPDKADLLFDGTYAAAKTAAATCGNVSASTKGFHGPFGLFLLADKDFQEQTAVYFYLVSTSGGNWKAVICSDQRRSSLQIGVAETTYGAYVPVLKKDKYLTMRILVDHSIVQSFVQGGRVAITARVYPTLAVGDAAGVYIFNNGTSDIQLYSIKAWKMSGINIVQL